MSRVLSTEEARAAIRNMQNIIRSGLSEQINQLNTQGQTLSQPNVWDGPLAERFRGEIWPSTHSALEKARTELEELNQKLEQIAANIFAAGGGQ